MSASDEDDKLYWFMMGWMAAHEADSYNQHMQAYYEVLGEHESRLDTGQGRIPIQWAE